MCESVGVCVCVCVYVDKFASKKNSIYRESESRLKHDFYK